MKAYLYDREYRLVKWLLTTNPPPPRIKIPELPEWSPAYFDTPTTPAELNYTTYYFIREVEYCKAAIYWIMEG